MVRVRQIEPTRTESEKGIRVSRTRRRRGLVYIPTVALAEAVFQVQSGYVSIRRPFDEWVRDLSRNSFFLILDLTTEVILRAFSMRPIANPFDRLIAATALEWDFPLITADDAITRSRMVECLWDE